MQPVNKILFMSLWRYLFACSSEFSLSFGLFINAHKHVNDTLLIYTTGFFTFISLSLPCCSDAQNNIFSLAGQHIGADTSCQQQRFVTVIVVTDWHTFLHTM